MPRKALPQISEAEFKVMKIVWKYAPVSTVEITEYLRPSTHWSYNTVQTLLKRLLQKGALSYEKRSRVFVYTPLVAETDYIRQESRSFLDKYYDGSFSSMVSAFVHNGELSPEDLAELQNLLTEKSQKKA
ncbi:MULTISPECIES: BlaI/MecI/CopY family transcriptional regulator [Lachnospiraceae]|jgi:BlaI family penicillinase repressor|uniref:BlaI/MecI/CopY family transcriptional regulator n=1 Tax=Faecalicatena acetigenes TaxID=2981790 RepID=A0ABT2TCH3_9FIRM|nr:MULTISPECIES: BlaI/MecI/CopY family transcriptional regulator [Lachnospiraceae]MCU6747964.1 BlaI/MecI/CopY family transcriptional regulator [Faecalicatena acetigenes]RGT72719.1 BlaI/MecI/CopY family transcriptional regulator [Ruminococcus sp. AF18-22]SCI18750.1 Regulatory protein BlaI [uncultured Clostridium sp.]